MSVLTSKLQDIYSKLSSLLPQFKSINIKNLSSLSEHIEEMVIGENKMSLWTNKSITSVTEDDLSGVTTIGEYAFYNCTSLASITIPNSVTTIGGSVFNNCTSLTSIIIPDSVTNIGSMAFRDCKTLSSITVPDSVTNIGSYAFSDCTNLTNITIGATSIGNSAFHSCFNLTSVIISESATMIGGSAFYQCTSLTDIYLNPTTPPTLGSTSAIPGTTTIHVPVGSGDAYKSATNWSYHSDRIVEDIQPS